MQNLGVTFVQVIEGDGMSEHLLEAALSEWRRKHPVPEAESATETQPED